LGIGSEGEAGGDELLGVGGVGGEEDILRRAVGELLGERGGGAEGGDELDAGGVLVGGGEGGDDGLEVGGAGELELFGLGAEWRGCDQESEAEDSGPDSFEQVLAPEDSLRG
jgi:hypothetical protein